MTELSQYVKFNCIASTYASSMACDKLVAAIKDIKGVTEEDHVTITSLGNYYSCTTDVTFAFDGKERQQLRDWKAAWEKVKGDPGRLWELRKNTPHILMVQWINDFNAAQSLFDVPDEQKPLGWLSDEQQAEAANPNSPLVGQDDAGKLAS